MSEMAVAYERQRHRIDVAEYCRMYDAGVFGPNAQLELIDGELIDKVRPMNPPHASVVGRAHEFFLEQLGHDAFVRCQLPVWLGDYSEPQPDFAIVRRDASGYSDRHPGPEDIFLLVEVCDSSRNFDRDVKVPLYARAGIPEVWLLDLLDDRIYVYREPVRGRYATSLVVECGGAVSSPAFPDRAFAASELLLPR